MKGGSLRETGETRELKKSGGFGELEKILEIWVANRYSHVVSTVQEIQAAIAGLPDQERLRLFNWVHTQEESDPGNDPDTLAEAEKGARQLDAGLGVSLEDARKLTSKWTTK